MGGVQFSSYYFIQELSKYPEYEIKLLLPKHGQFSKLCKKNSIPFSIYNSRKMYSSSLSLFDDSIRLPNFFAWIYNSINIFKNSKNIRTVIKKDKSAVVLSKGLYSHFMTLFANIRLSNKLIWHMQDLINNHFGGLFLIIINYFAKIGPDYIICDGDSIFKSLNKYNQNKAAIILNGIKKDLFQKTHKLRISGRREFSISKNAYVIGHVGRFTPWKGQIKLVEAFINYSKKNPLAILLLIGKPIFDTSLYINEIKNIINRNGLEDKIILTGFRSDLDKMFSIMDLFIYPSIEKDTSPLALISAISSGLPVAASSIESLQDIIEKVPAISLFNPLYIPEIITIYQKFEDKKLRSEIGNSIKLEFEDHFTISKNTKKVIDIIKSV